eukprot:6181139-Pleurochrysis_carterae.AAC.3
MHPARSRQVPHLGLMQLYCCGGKVLSFAFCMLDAESLAGAIRDSAKIRGAKLGLAIRSCYPLHISGHSTTKSITQSPACGKQSELKKTWETNCWNWRASPVWPSVAKEVECS